VQKEERKEWIGIISLKQQRGKEIFDSELILEATRRWQNWRCRAVVTGAIRRTQSEETLNGPDRDSKRVTVGKYLQKCWATLVNAMLNHPSQGTERVV